MRLATASALVIVALVSSGRYLPAAVQAQEPPLETATVFPTATATASVLPAPTWTPSVPTETVESASPSPQPTATATPVSDPDVAEATIGEAGGSLSSVDGRVTLVFPAGATGEPLRVRVRTGASRSLPENGAHHEIGLWDFQAAAVDRAWAPVATFAQPISIVAEPRAVDLDGLMWPSVTMYRFDDGAQAWQGLPTEFTAHRQWTATTDHFSEYQLSADEAVQLPPLTDQASVNLNSGSAQLALPIALPPGRAGFAPSLALTYSSASVNEMKTRWSMGSWAGVGFNLDLPYITQTSSGGVAHYHLNLNGVSDEIVAVQNGSEIVYRLKRENHLKIKKSCDDGPAGQPCWTVIDKAGTVYIFGGTEDSYRYWNDQWECFFGDCGSNPPPEHPYRWDLSHATDVHGNNYAIAYTREMAINHSLFEAGEDMPNNPYVMASYPSVLTYNEGQDEEVRVEFTTGYDYAHTDTKGGGFPYSQTLYVRDDSPVKHSGASSNPTCKATGAPYVMDTKHLTQVDVKAKDPNASMALSRVRRYTFDYEPQVEGCDDGGNPDGAGALTLDAVTLWDRQQPETADALYTQSFDYTSLAFDYEGGCTLSYNCAFTRPFLTQYQNGFGGEIEFSYAERAGGSGANFWSRQVLVGKTETQGWGGSPDVSTSYAYSTYPDYVGTNANADFKGYAQATATDPQGHYTVHKFHTVTAGPPKTYSPLEGREYESASYASGGGAFLVKNEQSFSTAFTQDAVTSGVDDVAFVFMSQAKTTLDDGKVLQTDYIISDGVGGTCNDPLTTCEVTQTRERGDTSISTDDRTTEQHYHRVYNAGADLYLVRPKWTKTYAGTGTGGTLLAQTALYYDGASSFDTAPTKGNLTATRATEKTSPSTTYVCAYLQYDSAGNLTRTSVPTTTPSATTCPGATASPGGGIPSGVASSEVVYDSSFDKFPLTQKQPFVSVALETTTAAADFDFVLGAPLRTTLTNGNVIERQYDSFGRVDSAWDTLNDPSYPAVAYEYTWGAERQAASDPNKVKVTTRTGTGEEDLISTLACLDGFGRRINTVTLSTETQATVRGYTQFDDRGLPSKQYLPHAAFTLSCTPSESGLFAETAYDALGRAVSTTDAAGNETTHAYAGLATTTVDPKGHKTRSVADAFGRTATVQEYTGDAEPYSLYATAAYEYDLLDNLKKVTDARGNLTQMSYDMLGRKTSMSDPDMGAWTNAYDARGNLTQQTDARSFTTTLSYDALNRLTGKTYSNGDPAVSYHYDSYTDSVCSQSTPTAAGVLTKMSDGAGAEWSCYDIRGRTDKTRRTVDAQGYDVSRSYDLANRLVDLTYPDGEVVRYGYDAVHGGLASMCEWTGSACDDTYVEEALYTPVGALDTVQLGNGLTTDYAYGESAYPTRITSIVTGAVQDLSFTYDDANNVESVADGVTDETITYSYDALDRLTGATGFADGSEARYEYDAIGNLTRKQEGALDLKLEYPASGATSVRPHAATAAKFRDSGGTYRTLAYDANGNLDYVSSTGTSNYTFDAENRLTQRTYGAATTTYTYDGAGTMLKRTTAGVSGSASTVYVGGIYEKNVTTGGVTKRYEALGRTIATRNPDGEVQYLLADHLGSTLTVTDDSGAVVSTRKTWPFGADRSMAGDQRLTDLWYTGQREEDFDGLGLYNYKARFYSTTLGRFVSVDPLVGAAYDPQSWNPYSYVLNNPLRFVDPFGLTPQCLLFCTSSPDDIVVDVDEGTYYTEGESTEAKPLHCPASCQQLQALASVGWTYDQWQSWGGMVYAAHQQFVGALQYCSVVDCSNQPAAVPLVTCPGPECINHPSVSFAGPGNPGGGGFDDDWVNAFRGYAEDRIEYFTDPVNLLDLAIIAASKGRSGRQPPRGGGFRSTDALRQHNRMFRDAVRKVGLNEAQAERFHRAATEATKQGGPMSLDELVELAKLFK